MSKKIGIVAQYLNSRNDIREIISLLSQYSEVCLYLRRNDFPNAVPGIEIREIHKKKRSIKNFLLQRLFGLFGVLPKSKHNYYITEAFKIANTKTHWLFKIEKRLILLLSRVLPKWLTYDQYLDWLHYSDATDLSGVDVFLCFSEIYDDSLLSHLLHTNKKIVVYVYSWDHPCKMMRFSKRIDKYLVWNEGLKEDMITLQGIAGDKITIMGSTQLAYIAEFKKSKEKQYRPYGFDYFYFGCATGTLELVEQEVKFIEKIARVLIDSHPTLKLVVRPYPFLLAWKLYLPLKQLPNVVFDDGYRTGENSLSLSREAIYDKFAKVQSAKAFLHLGTTLGFEAAYFDTPVLQIDFQSTDTRIMDIKKFIHQYQNDKYLFLRTFPNIIQSPEDLEVKTGLLLDNPNDFLTYNRFIAKQTPLQDFASIEYKLRTLLINL